jgi:hypothetical protein
MGRSDDATWGDTAKSLFAAFGVYCAVGVVLASCATKPTTLEKAAPAPVAAVPTCPAPVKVWPMDKEKALATWLSAQPEGSIQVQAFADYGRMRKAAAAACPAK